MKTESLDVRDYVSVEPSERGYALTVWTADGQRSLVHEYRYQGQAEAAKARMQHALATWPGWANPHLDAMLDQLTPKS